SAGMITNVSREDGGWTAYTYDSLDRLLSEQQYASTGLTYSALWNYDLAGNRTLAVTNGVTNLYSYAAGNILTNFGTGTLVQSDLAGNITNLQYSANKKLSLYWNGRYELVEVRSNGVTVEKYDYDALGRRARIIAGTVTNTFVYSGPHIVAEWSNNVLARSYAYGPAVDDVLSMTTYGAATNTYFYLKDAIGSVHALVNTNGVVVEQYRYTAWGEVTVLSSNRTVLAASAYGNRFTFQGREVSFSTGLLFFRSRYYSASLGRWLSKDRMGISGGADLYVAFNNAPTIFSDAYGNCPDMELPDGWPPKNLMYEDPLKARIRDMMRDFKNMDWSLMVPVAGEMRLVEQYGLKAVRDGVYPVMKRGFPNAVDWVSLKAGDIWKYGTTKNPLTRYTQKFLHETALRYEKLSSGSLGEALSAEKAKIVEYLTDRGVLPPGNKILK
ncbi:MAG: RHS repeat-associated core domain-containing protein, partial [bacterium]